MKHLTQQVIIGLCILLNIQCSETEDAPSPIPNNQSELAATSESHKSDVSQCHACDYIVTSQVTDGNIIGIRPGDIICLQGSQNYASLVFKNIKGTKDRPVVIRNCGGVAKINTKGPYGVKFEHSEHFKLIGNGQGSNSLGIKISTERGYFLTMENFTTAFEIAQVEIAGYCHDGLSSSIGGFAGIGIKTSPYQDCQLFTDESRKAWVMRDVSVHNNYIHDTGGEGIYIGHGFYSGRKENTCPYKTYSHSIKGLLVYENIIENVGNDGIQIKNADENVAVFKNIIRNYGTRKKDAQNEGLFIGEGTTGKFFLNTIAEGSGDGIKVQGLGDLDIFQNKILLPEKDGINVSLAKYGYRKPSGYFNIERNTIFKPHENGFVFYGQIGGRKKFANNMIIRPRRRFIKYNAKVTLSNNQLTYIVPGFIRDEPGQVTDALELLRFDPL